MKHEGYRLRRCSPGLIQPFQCTGWHHWQMNQTAVPRQKSVISGPVLTGAVLPSSLGLGIFSQNVALVHYYPLFLDGFQVAKWNLPGGNWKPLLCALSAINPFLFALCTFKHCHPIPPSVSSSFNSLHLFSQARFSVSRGSCSPLDSPLFPISLQTSTAGTVVFRQYLERKNCPSTACTPIYATQNGIFFSWNNMPFTVWFTIKHKPLLLSCCLPVYSWLAFAQLATNFRKWLNYHLSHLSLLLFAADHTCI